MRFITSSNAILLALLLCGISIVESVPPATARSSQDVMIIARRRIPFRTGRRQSWRRVGGYSRSGACTNGAKDKEITAIIPPPQLQENRIDNKELLEKDIEVLDKTSSDHPIFFVNLPALPGTQAEFILQTDSTRQRQDTHQVNFKLTNKSGIVGIQLSENSPALQIGQRYPWSLSVICNPKDSTSNIIVKGWVERVKPGPVEQTIAPSLIKQGIWQDTLSAHALMLYKKPNDRPIVEDWASLMEEVGLPQFKESKVVQMVTAQSAITVPTKLPTSKPSPTP